MPGAFSTVDFPWNANRSINGNAALGIYSAADYSTTYGTGGNDTAAVQAAITAAASGPGGGIAFLPPPVSGAVNIGLGADGLAQCLSIPNGVWLVGAQPGVTVNVIPGSNVDWIASTGTHNNVDYRTTFIVNYVNVTLGSNPYTVYDPSRPAQLSIGGGIQNLTFVGEATQSSGLGHGAMLNAARGFQFINCAFQNCVGEQISLWDCRDTVLLEIASTASNRALGVHRACYNTSVLSLVATGSTSIPVTVYTEQYQVPSGPLLTLTPRFTKFFGTHEYSTTSLASAFDLGGSASVNIYGATADGITGSLVQSETRFGAVVYETVSL